MKILIVGASGLVGSNCLKYFTLNNFDCLGTHFSSITEQTIYFNTLNPSVEELEQIATFNPEVILHCGALTYVDYCEDHVEESYEKTVQSTINLVKLAKQYQSKFIYISTDYVFDGQKGMYSEEDTINPLSVYGEHKYQGEEVVKNSGLDYLIVRVAKVFGHESRQKNFVARLAKTIEDTGQLSWKAFTDQETTAVDAWDIAKAIYLLLVCNKSGYYHLGYGQMLSAYDITMKVAQHYPEAQINVDKITKEDFKQAADRPALGGLSNKKFLKEFPNFQFKTIEDYLNER